MKNPVEPYRILFPVGTFFSLWGAFLWIYFVQNPSTAYPGPAHSRMMIGGFLFSYATGFLMTAIPKMTGTGPARKGEAGAALFFAVMTGLCSLGSQPGLFFASLAAGFLLLLSFGLTRFLRRRKPAPDFFVLVASGICAGLLGSLLLLFGISSGAVFLFQLTILSLVLGIGCRLIPVISGLPPRSADANRPILQRLELLFVVFVLWGSALAEANGFRLAALASRALVATILAVRWWKILEIPRTKSRLRYPIKTSGVLVLLGLWAATLQPAISLHWMHLTYIGGFGLMTFTVASRVTLAHGGFDLSFEEKSRSLLLVSAFFLLAALTRAAAPLVPNGYMSHLQYAAVLWMGGVAWWSSTFLWKMIRTRAPSTC